jgi:hypothetical protein
MRHPRRAVLALLIPVFALAACGDDSPVPEADGTLPPVSTSPGTTPGDTSGDNGGRTYEVRKGADDVVISVSREGGFVPVEMIFANTPAALVTGDGRVLSTGPVVAIYPGPLLPNIQQRSISPAGVQALLAKADELGLLGNVEYAGNDRVADAPDTVVTIAVDGEVYTHRAYALEIEGPGTEDDPARANLAEFVAAMSDLPSTVGDSELGPEEPFETDQYLIRATPADPEAAATEGIEPTVVPWPADAPVRLADAAECAPVPVATFEPLFADATTLTFFTEPGPDGAEVAYQVTPVPQFPGRTC